MLLQRLWGIIFILACFGLSACDDGLQPGIYKGTLSESKAQGTPLSKKRVSIKIEETQSLGHLSAFVYDVDDSLIYSAKINIKGHDSFSIKLPHIRPEPFHLKRFSIQQIKGFHMHCFRSKSGFPVLTFCYNHSRFDVELKDAQDSLLMALSGFRFSDESSTLHVPALEEAKSFKLSEAIDLAYLQSFESKGAIEDVIQAKQRALAAWTNLVPHLSSNLIWNAEPGYVSAIATVQAFAPFLLPSYIIQAKSADIQHQIKEHELYQTRANIVVTLEELSYSFERDSAIIDAYENVWKQFEDFKAQVETKHSTLGDAATKELVKIASYIQSVLTDTKANFESVLLEERFSLASAMGFQNPHAVNMMLIDDERTSIEDAKELDELSLLGEVPHRSFDVDRFNYLLQLVALQKIEHIFTFMDPCGDPKRGMGVHFCFQQNEMDSQQEKLEQEQKNAMKIARQGISKAVLAYNSAIAEQNTTHPPISITKIEARYKALLDTAIQTGQLDETFCNTLVQLYLGQHIKVLKNRANFRIARAQLDRLLLEGYHERLSLKMPTTYIPKARQKKLSKVA